MQVGKLICYFVGHKFNISVLDVNGVYIHDRCERCGATDSSAITLVRKLRSLRSL
jgi:hypothetical protein